MADYQSVYTGKQIDEAVAKTNANETAISSLESRTKNLEDSKVNVNTGTFDPTSDNPASQKAIADRTIDLSRIVDSKGHQRFIEGNLKLETSYDNVVIKYAKWSLSGTHLMIVVFGTYTGSNVNLNFRLNFPLWIYQKIYNDDNYHSIYTSIPFRTGAVIGDTEFEAVSELQTSDSSGYIRIYHLKDTSNTLWFRLQYDLLIDTD